jgi:hypothetical protein
MGIDREDQSRVKVGRITESNLACFREKIVSIPVCMAKFKE